MTNKCFRSRRGKVIVLLPLLSCIKTAYTQPSRRFLQNNQVNLEIRLHSSRRKENKQKRRIRYFIRIDLFRLLVGPSIYSHPRDDEGSKALLPLCTSAERINDYYKRFAHRSTHNQRKHRRWCEGEWKIHEIPSFACKNYVADVDLIEMVTLLIGKDGCIWWRK